eukprot:scaffold21743_cov144-Skeletonema_dohrnii-CCMP3373.AAC.10
MSIDLISHSNTIIPDSHKLEVEASSYLTLNSPTAMSYFLLTCTILSKDFEPAICYLTSRE